MSGSNKKTRDFLTFNEYKNLNEKEFCEKAEEIKNYICELEERIKDLNVSGIEDLKKREKSEKALREIEWMLYDTNDEKAEYVPEYGKKALKSGCNAFIEKPVKAKILKDNMKRLLANQ